MHKLLERQLQASGISIDENFLSMVNQTYKDADAARKLLEHSLEVSSQEMRELYEKLKETSQKKLQATQERFERLLHELRSQYILYSFDKNFICTYVSNSVTDVLGYTKEEFVGNNLRDILTNDPINEQTIIEPQKFKQEKIPQSNIASVYHKDGSIRYLELDRYPIVNSDGELLEIEGIAKDITEQYLTQEKMDYLSTHDILTGLTNRYNLYNKLEYLIEDAKRNGKEFALFYLDLDNFKLINDTFGHDAGDAFLKDTATLLQKQIRQNDILARIGGDEFVIVYTNIHKNDIAKLAQGILETFTQDLDTKYKHLQVTVSIGISFYPNDGEDIDSLLQSADKAMYAIKHHGKNNYSIS
ncbi:sensor domain-containing diguanylate cyclase [Sulfurimonas sp.]|uniref:sensor domain-containing diguanylate cyclase n=1 Tax=Sulfurimonas sp. TaxID=2022749 RepID=UPI0026294389|nr:sensor domain-containing diguanylate cyclase [Sulfurimonas sp.]